MRYTGIVKWFNTKSGFGFITVCDEGDQVGKEIFVHHSSLPGTHYMYLIKGEYIEFDLVKSANDKHEFIAQNVTGIKGGIIMCETRRLDSNPSVQREPSVREPSVQSTDGFTKVEKRRR